ncbi:hypothetical protein [Novosphingobium taihuense]|uniref:Uncharacterized protein n=1 Tax=Novosphingobium taihuense TaxID=260085 RepID=A0A7W7ESD2_9SPHN|nr:hypothetical protein [Novosphingobium taihuense]MBB4612168.1 hypothetical protein [Novosphingobium taihuense]TWH88478.1 hypothetical protein IQ25_00600 [Novosphingobium taihuense]
MMLLWLYRLCIVAILAFALRKGEEPERFVSAIIIAAATADAINHAAFGSPAFYALDPGHLVIDTWALVGMLWVALRANRGWPLWACSAQIIVVLAHMSKLIDLSLVRYGYFTMTQLPAAIQMVALLAGTRAHLLRKQHIGPYHAWRPDLQPA